MSSLHDREPSGGKSRYIQGDANPEDRSFLDPVKVGELLTLLIRNGNIRKVTSWVAREAVRPRFVMATDRKVPATKHNKPYLFPSILEYLEWIGFFQEVEKAITWSRLFGDAIMVMFKEGEEAQDGKFAPIVSYDSCRAYFPLANGMGYQIVQKGDSYEYDLTFFDALKSSKHWLIAKERVIPFHAPHLELRFEGSSCVEPIAKTSIVQEQMLQSIMQRLAFVGAGIARFNVTGADEIAVIEASLGKSLNYLKPIYTTDDVEKSYKIDVPDLKTAQFREFFDIMQEVIANGSNMSKKLLSGDSQGDISSAKWDVEISYCEVYQTQRHYKRAIEDVMFYLGIEDTTFMWNDPFPTEQEDNKDDRTRTTEDRTDTRD